MVNWPPVGWALRRVLSPKGDLFCKGVQVQVCFTSVCGQVQPLDVQRCAWSYDVAYTHGMGAAEASNSHIYESLKTLKLRYVLATITTSSH
jgi:hypothetical protein